MNAETFEATIDEVFDRVRALCDLGEHITFCGFINCAARGDLEPTRRERALLAKLASDAAFMEANERIAALAEGADLPIGLGVAVGLAMEGGET